MTTPLRLDTFTLLASQHAELMGWKSVEVKDITGIPAKDGEYLCYSFEIWGVGTPSLSGGEEQEQSRHSTPASSRAAKQPEL